LYLSGAQVVLLESQMPFTLPANQWLVFLLFYFESILLETPVLLLGLSRRHSLGVRLFAGIWLTACTYPVVFFVIPALVDQRQADTNEHQSNGTYLAMAETFAPVAECLLFWLAFGWGAAPGRTVTVRDYAVIVLANLTSFLVGLMLEPLLWNSTP
jgi:hypothetical protein